MTDIKITLTNEQLVQIGGQIPGTGEEGSPPPSEPKLMEIDFDEIWVGREIEPPRENYPNRDILCTDVDGYSIACKMPDVIEKPFKLRIVDVQTSTPNGRAVVWSERRDFTEPYLSKMGTGGTSANGDLLVMPEMAGKTVYYNGMLSTGTAEVPYEVKLQGYSY